MLPLHSMRSSWSWLEVSISVEERHSLFEEKFIFWTYTNRLAPQAKRPPPYSTGGMSASGVSLLTAVSFIQWVFTEDVGHCLLSIAHRTLFGEQYTSQQCGRNDKLNLLDCLRNTAFFIIPKHFTCLEFRWPPEWFQIKNIKRACHPGGREDGEPASEPLYLIWSSSLMANRGLREYSNNNVFIISISALF